MHTGFDLSIVREYYQYCRRSARRPPRLHGSL